MTFTRAYYENQGREAARMGGICCSEPTITAAVIEMARTYLNEARAVADVGCGANLDYDRFIAEILGKRPVAIDFSMSFLRLAPRLPGVSLVQADSTALPICDASLDAVICSETIEHIEQDQVAIEEIARVMRPGGTLILTVPNLWNVARLIEMAKTRHFKVTMMPGHLREYSVPSLKQLLQPHFVILKWHAVGFGWRGASGARIDRMIERGLLKRFSKSLAVVCRRRS